MLTFDALNALLVAAAMFCAWHAPEGQRRQLGCFSVLFTLGWASFVASWSDYGPAALLWRTRLAIRSEDIWCMTDALLGSVVIAIAWDRWWAWALWATFLTQVGMHTMYRPFHAWDYPAYPLALGYVFNAQIAVFFMVGGKGAADRISRGHARLGLSFRTLSSCAGGQLRP